MIREAIKTVESYSSIDYYFQELSKGLDIISDKTRKKRQIKDIQKDLDSLVTDFSEGFLSKLKKAFSGYEMTKTSPLEGDVKYLTDMIFKIMNDAEREGNDYLASRIELLRIKLSKVQ